MNIAILGNGSVGNRLLSLLASKHQVQLCSRDSSNGLPSYAEGIRDADVVILAVPFLALEELLPTLAAELAGRIVVDATNPLNPDWSPVLLGQESSAGERVAQLLPESKVVKAFNTIFADAMTPESLVRDGQRITTFIASDDTQAGARVAKLAADAGFTPLETGSLSTSRYLEAMAHLNIQLAVNQNLGTGITYLYHLG